MEVTTPAVLIALAVWTAITPHRDVLPGGPTRPTWSRVRTLLATVRLWRIVPGARGRLARRRAEALSAGSSFAAELRSGQPLRAALHRSLRTLAPRANAAATWGGDVAAALRQDAASGRLPLLAGLAACWEVAEGSGAGLACAVERLVATSRAAEEVRVQLESHLAAPRATARLLTALPLLGLLLGVSLGADPLGWLLGTPIGLMCLSAGTVLTLLGLLWTGRIAARVERLA